MSVFIASRLRRIRGGEYRPDLRGVVCDVHVGGQPRRRSRIFGTGLAMAPMAWRADLTRLRVAAFAAAAGYAIALGLWWFGWNGERLDAIGGIWFSNFPGLAAAAMALACRARIAIGYLLLVVAGAPDHQPPGAIPEQQPLIPDVAWAFAFSLVFVAATSMARRTAQILDSTRRDAYRAAAQAPTRRRAPMNATGSPR